MVMFIIKRTILKEIELSVKSRPITLITGARQVGKSTLAQLFMKDGFSYVLSSKLFKVQLFKLFEPYLYM